MPNHITNIVKMEGSEEQIKECRKAIKPDNKKEGYDIIDFEKIIPMPKEVFRGDLGDEQRRESNGMNWYDWSIANWGTKWNAYDQVILDDDRFSFDTAWACPLPIFEALSRKFPKIVFSISYADEDIGSNCGHFVLYDGEILGEYTPKYEEKPKEAERFALAVKDGEQIEPSSSLKIEILKVLNRKK